MGPSDIPLSSESCPIPNQNEDGRIRQFLNGLRCIAVVGMSPNSSRVSRQIGSFLRSRGVDVIPVHPRAREIEGLRVYPTLEAVPPDGKIDLVSVFVAAERAGAIADEAAKIGARAIWFQPGAENPEAEARARELGLEVVSGRCIMADHMRLLG